MKILIVDDSRAMRNIVKRGLQQAGYGDHEMLDADSAKVARQLIEEVLPDLVFVDINMPETTGIEMVESLRADGIDVTFGISSAVTNEKTLNHARMLGSQFFLKKPFSAEEIQLALEPVIRGIDMLAKVKAENKKLQDHVQELTQELAILKAAAN